MRTLVLAVLVGSAVLALPQAARAQWIAPEQALLNRVPAQLYIVATTTASITDDPVDGERALLNTSHFTVTASSNQPLIIADAHSVDGVRALLNRASS